MQGISSLHGAQVDSCRIIVPSREQDVHALQRAYLPTIGKSMSQQPDMSRWLASQAGGVIPSYSRPLGQLSQSLVSRILGSLQRRAFPLDFFLRSPILSRACRVAFAGRGK